jgi:hypothetical protein
MDTLATDTTITTAAAATTAPEAPTGWLVRHMKPRGAPAVVYGRSGTPLVLPVPGIDDLRGEVDLPGKYRLDPVDEHGKAVLAPRPNTCTWRPPRHRARLSALATSGTAIRPRRCC